METTINYCVEAVGVDAIEQATGRHGGDAERRSIGFGGDAATGAIGIGGDSATGVIGHGGDSATGVIGLGGDAATGAIGLGGADATEGGEQRGDAATGAIGLGGVAETEGGEQGGDAARRAIGHGGGVAPRPDNREAMAALRADCLTNRRSIDLIVLHCTDTQPDRPFTIEQLRACHRARRFGAWPGYHVYIRTDGTMHYCRPLDVVGCHVKGHNAHSIGVCYEGGHRPASADSGFGFVPYHGSDKWGDTRTPAQRVVMDQVVRLLLEYYPEARVLGHNRLAAKACPCFETE